MYAAHEVFFKEFVHGIRMILSTAADYSFPFFLKVDLYIP